MFTIIHEDITHELYYKELQDILNKDIKYNSSLIIPKNFTPNHSINHIIPILKKILSQKDWDIMIIDKTSDFSNELIWESLTESLHLVLKKDIKLKIDKHVRIIRHDNINHDKKCINYGIINLILFSNHINKKIYKLSFWYYIIAVIITLSLCYIFHISYKYKKGFIFNARRN